MWAQSRAAIMMLVVLTVVTGMIYPLVITGVAQMAFPSQANGSLIAKDGKTVGSSLIGQPFDDPKYFWGHPSATSPFPNNAAASSGSNQGPTNPDGSTRCGPPIRETPRRFRWISSPPPAAGSIRISAQRRRSTRCREWRKHGSRTRRWCGRWWSDTSKAARWGFWASRG
jgi:K+-transporting ATPase, c chain